MKIRSVIDVITNSSTEVFSMIDRTSVEKLKEMINLILMVGDSQKKWDDLFDIFLIPGECAEEAYRPENRDGRQWDDLNFEEQVEYCLNYANYWNTNLYPEVMIIPKTEDIPKKLVDLLYKSVDLGLTPVDATYG